MIFATIRQSGEWQSRCKSWLDQVLYVERATAERLLDGIRYISYEDLMCEFQRDLNRLLDQLKEATALYPVTNTEKLNAFDTYKNDIPFGTNEDLGSEGDLGHLCRDVCKSRHDGGCSAFPVLEKMRSLRVRHVVLVTDTISSGRQVTQFLNWIWGARTIRSWWSAGLIRIHVVSFLVSTSARDLLKQHPSDPHVVGIQAARTGQNHWPLDEREPIIALCKQYGPGKYELGFQNQFSLDVFSYACPNNVPAILRLGHRKTKFRGLFQRRPSAVSGNVISGPDANLEALSSWLGIRASSISDLVCFALMTKPATPEQLSARLGLPIVTINGGLSAAIDAGYACLLRHAYRLTEEGARVARGLAVPTNQSVRTRIVTGSRYDYLPQKRSPASPSSNALSPEGVPDG